MLLGYFTSENMNCLLHNNLFSTKSSIMLFKLKYQMFEIKLFKRYDFRILVS